MNALRFHDVLLELVDEDPFALRAVLRLLEIEFTTAVKTLCVSCEARPRLRVNLAFVEAECRTDEQVKAVLCHEFLHVLLRHTEERRPLTQARHLAADAVINAIIHRELGPAYSSLMSRYYAAETGVRALLRPPRPAERKAAERSGDPLGTAWLSLYEGDLVADDLEALAATLEPGLGLVGTAAERDPQSDSGPHLLGNHGEGWPPEGPVAEALADVLRRMNGSGVWRAPKSRGVGADAYAALFDSSQEKVARWERTTLAVLRRFLTPDPRSRKNQLEAFDYRVPVLTPQDRRAFLGALWQPFLPEARWTGEALAARGTTQVYLDVSGSMHAEMPAVIRLLSRLSAHLRLPFWAFSDQVAPAHIAGGKLVTVTSGGTSIACVLEHLARTRPRAAVIVTDGYIEALHRSALTSVRGIRLHALVTRDGSVAQLDALGLPHTQLERYPS